MRNLDLSAKAGMAELLLALYLVAVANLVAREAPSSAPSVD